MSLVYNYKQYYYDPERSIGDLDNGYICYYFDCSDGDIDMYMPQFAYQPVSLQDGSIFVFKQSDEVDNGNHVTLFCREGQTFNDNHPGGEYLLSNGDVIMFHALIDLTNGTIFWQDISRSGT